MRRIACAHSTRFPAHGLPVPPGPKRHAQRIASPIVSFKSKFIEVAVPPFETNRSYAIVSAPARDCARRVVGKVKLSRLHALRPQPFCGRLLNGRRARCRQNRQKGGESKLCYFPNIDRLKLRFFEVDDLIIRRKDSFDINPPPSLSPNTPAGGEHPRESAATLQVDRKAVGRAAPGPTGGAGDAGRRERYAALSSPRCFRSASTVGSRPRNAL